MTLSPPRRARAARRGGEPRDDATGVPEAAAARARDAERALGRTLIAEIPAEDDLVLFSEDATRFYYGDRSIDKDQIVAVRVLINGAPIAAYVSTRVDGAVAAPATSFEDRPEGIARDRWDVAIETARRDDARGVRRDPGARVAGTGAGGLRCGQDAEHRAAGRCRCRSYHSVSVAPARWFTARASTNSRSDRRLT